MSDVVDLSGAPPRSAAAAAEPQVFRENRMLERGVDEIREFVEHNPSVLRAAVFSLSAIQALYCGLGIFNLFSAAWRPVEYLINFYTAAFSVTVLVLEAKPEWPFVGALQRQVFFQAHFLSTVTGRALFLIFVGTFGMAQLDNDLLSFLIGVGFFLLGIAGLLSEKYLVTNMVTTTPTGFAPLASLSNLAGNYMPRSSAAWMGADGSSSRQMGANPVTDASGAQRAGDNLMQAQY